VRVVEFIAWRTRSSASRPLIVACDWRAAVKREVMSESSLQ
jgi:hypothetical protein